MYQQEFRRILVIDDNRAIHEDFRKILCLDDHLSELNGLAESLFDEAPVEFQQEKYEIDSAYQGQEGLMMLTSAIATDNAYAMAFIDVRMPPGWDGIETAERLWAVDPKLQIVICTAYSDYNWSVMRQRFGQTDRLLLLKKPFDNIEVLQLASALTQKRRLSHFADLKDSHLNSLVEARTIALRTLAETDSLTQLPNRFRFLTELEQCVRDRKAFGRGADAVLYLDLDNFKLVNDSLGHGIGDAMLVEVAHRLKTLTESAQRTIKSSDGVVGSGSYLAARLGGDEFAILIVDVESVECAEAFARKVINRLREPFLLRGRTIYAGVSVGVAAIDSDAVDCEEVLMKADTAMFAAKSSGTNGVSLFDNTMHLRVLSRMSVESDIRLALQDDEFELYFQPIKSLKTFDTFGYEALIRWRGEDGMFRSPLDFIPVAEETGQIVEMGLWVIDRAVELAANFGLDSGNYPNTRIAVNVSRIQLIAPGFVESVQEVLTRYGMPGSRFSIEITESTVAQNPEVVIEVLHQLRAMGLQIYLDDFGTGYSSLSFLNRYPIDVLKIDRSFISGCAENREAIMEAIILMANAMGIVVIAEGVETEEQLEILKRLDCPLAQGYLFGRPQPASVWLQHDLAECR